MKIEARNNSNERRYSIAPGVVLERVADEFAATNANGDIIVLNDTAGIIASLVVDGLSVAEAAIKMTSFVRSGLLSRI